MLHWHPWWLRSGDESSRAPPGPVALHEPALWDPEAWLQAQAKLWDRWLESNRAWWRTCAGALPQVHWPDPPVVQPPATAQASDDPAAPAVDAGAALRRRPRPARVRRHEAGGTTHRAERPRPR